MSSTVIAVDVFDPELGKIRLHDSGLVTLEIGDFPVSAKLHFSGEDGIARLAKFIADMALRAGVRDLLPESFDQLVPPTVEVVSESVTVTIL